jgi:hypothetical protein
MGLQLSGSIQLEGNLLVTGSANSVFENILVSGKLTAQEIETQFVSASIIYSSGSNKFGDEITDNQQFTGSVDISGSLGVNGIPTFGSVSGSVNTIPKFTGGYLLGDSGIFESGSNVGIGTTSPSDALHVATSNEYQISWSRTIAGKRWALGVDSGATFISNRTDNTIPIYITNGGNVGIGTTSPGAKLEIVGGLNTYQRITNSTNSVSLDLLVGNATDGAFLGTPGNYSLRFATNDTERMRITSAGNVGIGTDSPNVLGFSKALTISSSNSGIELTSDGNIVQGSFSASTNGLAISGVGANGIRFLSSSSGSATERMRITSGGNVGIGTDNPTAKLDVNGAITINGTITNNGTGTGIYTKTVWAADTTNQISFENGRVSDSDDSTGRTVYFTWRGGPTFGGGVQLQHGANAWAAYTSDARLKTVVANIDSGLAAIMKLNPIKYKWTKEIETSRTVLGFTAQNVGEAIPEAMFKSWQDDELGDVLSYYQEYLTPYLVKAIQEQQQQIENLTTRLEALETK